MKSLPHVTAKARDVSQNLPQLKIFPPWNKLRPANESLTREANRRVTIDLEVQHQQRCLAVTVLISRRL